MVKTQEFELKTFLLCPSVDVSGTTTNELKPTLILKQNIHKKGFKLIYLKKAFLHWSRTSIFFLLLFGTCTIRKQTRQVTSQANGVEVREWGSASTTVSTQLEGRRKRVGRKLREGGGGGGKWKHKHLIKCRSGLDKAGHFSSVQFTVYNFGCRIHARSTSGTTHGDFICLYWLSVQVLKYVGNNEAVS